MLCWKNSSSGSSSGIIWVEASTNVVVGATEGTIGGAVAMVEVRSLSTAEMCDANSCSSKWVESGILDGGPPRVTIIVVMGADFEGALSSKTSLVLDYTPSKENINEASRVGDTLVEGPTSGSVDKEVSMTSMLTAIGGGMIARVAACKLSS